MARPLDFILEQFPGFKAYSDFDVARELQKIQTNQSVSPEQRRINAKNFLKNLETDAILRSIDYSDRPY